MLWLMPMLQMQMLDRDLEEAEEQYGMAVRAHMLVVESLMDLQYQRMKALEAEFAQDLKALEVIKNHFTYMYPEAT